MNNTKKYKRNIILDYAHTFIRNINITHGIWVPYLAFSGFSLFEIGLFEAIFHVASVTMEIPTGMIGDLIGRKFSRIVGIILLILYTLLILVGTEFWVIALAFFICGVGYTFESGSGEALVYDSLIELKEEHSFMKVQGKKEILFQLSSSIGLFVGGWIAVIAFDLNFILMIFVLAIALIPILLMTEIPQNKSIEKRTFRQLVNEHIIKSTNVVKKDKRLLFLILIFAFMLAPITSMFFYVQEYLIGLDFTIFHVGIILGIHSAAGVVGGILADRLEKKYKEKLILYIVPIFIVLSFWTVLIDQIVFIPFILLGFLDSIFYIVLSDYMNRLIPSQQRATVLSFSNLVFSCAMILIFPLFGLIADLSTLRVSFTLLAIVVTINFLALILLLKSKMFGNEFS